MTFITKQQFVNFCHQFNEPVVNRFLFNSGFANPLRALDLVHRQEIINVAAHMNADLAKIAPRFASSFGAFVTKNEIIDLFSNVFVKGFDRNPVKQAVPVVVHQVEDGSNTEGQEAVTSPDRAPPTHTETGVRKSMNDRSSTQHSGGFLTKRAKEEVADGGDPRAELYLDVRKLTIEPNNHQTVNELTKYEITDHIIKAPVLVSRHNSHADISTATMRTPSSLHKSASTPHLSNVTYHERQT